MDCITRILMQLHVSEWTSTNRCSARCGATRMGSFAPFALWGRCGIQTFAGNTKHHLSKRGRGPLVHPTIQPVHPAVHLSSAAAERACHGIVPRVAPEPIPLAALRAALLDCPANVRLREQAKWTIGHEAEHIPFCQRCIHFCQRSVRGEKERFGRHAAVARVQDGPGLKCVHRCVQR